MSTRQYIGARYVPKFANPIEWNSARAYEALEIVTHLQTSYTSKKPVPAGTAITNTEYWVATGNYNAQVEQYRQEVEEYSKDIGFITQPKILFIGDSYASYAEWPERVASLLGVPTTDYWVVSASGSAFAETGSASWEYRLRDWAGSHASICEDITDIICAGGINEAQNGIFANEWSAMTSFASYAKSTFPNARIRLAYIGACWYNSSQYSGRPGYNQLNVVRMWGQAGQLGMEYLAGCESVMFDASYFETDGLHPNTAGSNAIVGVLYDAIKTGSAKNIKRGVVNITPVDGVTYGEDSYSAGTMHLADCIGDFSMNLEIGSISGFTLGGNTWQALGNMPLPFSPQMHRTPCDIVYRVGSTYTKERGQIRVVDGVLSVLMATQNPDNIQEWITVTPNRIWIYAHYCANIFEF